jgi:glyoxalase family protein
MKISGLHHVTAIAGNPQRNLDFYAGSLGLRFLKRTVNFDDPSSYHFYFGDTVGTPGTILTFFPWLGARRGIHGSGEISATAFTIPSGSIDYWFRRLKREHVAVELVPKRFGEEVIRFADPDGMLIELIESVPSREVAPWNHDAETIHGFHSVSAIVRDPEETAKLLTETFEYRLLQESGNRLRFVASGESGAGRTIDLIAIPHVPRGRIAAGSVHHIAFRVPDEEQQKAWREKLIGLGYQVSPVMDRTYFHSIYFREPGGILFELATDQPGFTKDEPVDELGAHLRLPPWMEKERARIENALPQITVPAKVTV